MDHRASHRSYRLFSHTLTLDPTTVNTWPETTDVCCWHCCHSFETVPISIPRIMSQSDKSTYYEVYGVFCSVNCAKKFVLERKSYDQQQVLMQLHEMCCSVFGIPSIDVFTAKEAPPRFFLKMFGGNLSIEEFREKSLTTRTVLVMPPFVSHAMILESHSNNPGSPSTGVDERYNVVGEPLREGHHMLRGLRRPTRSVTPPELEETCAPSRFEEFITQMETEADKSSTAEAHPARRISVKRPRKKETNTAAVPVTNNGNTLNSFLMIRPTAEQPNNDAMEM